MSVKTVEKILKAINSMNRTTVQQKFDAFLCGELRREEEEEVQDYLLIDDEALLAFADKVAEKVDAGEIPLQKWPDDLPMPSMAQFQPSTSLPVTIQGLGVVWGQVKQLADQGVAWARDQVSETLRCLEEAMQQWRVAPAMASGSPRRRVVIRGRPASIDAQVINEHGPVQGYVAPLEVKIGPEIGPDRCFRLTLSTSDPDWWGETVVCTLLLPQEQKVSFINRIARDHGVVTFEETLQGSESASLEFHIARVPLDRVQLLITEPTTSPQ